MKKGYVLESINSFVVSVLLMPKRMGHRGYVLIIAINHITFHSIPRLDDKLNESYGSWFLVLVFQPLHPICCDRSFKLHQQEISMASESLGKNQKLLKKKKVSFSERCFLFLFSLGSPQIDAIIA